MIAYNRRELEFIIQEVPSDNSKGEKKKKGKSNYSYIMGTFSSVYLLFQKGVDTQKTPLRGSDMLPNSQLPKTELSVL